jgi:hypothetical protein
MLTMFGMTPPQERCSGHLKHHHYYWISLGIYHQRALLFQQRIHFFLTTTARLHICYRCSLQAVSFDSIFNIHCRGLTYMRRIDTSLPPLNTKTHNERHGEQSTAATTEAASSSASSSGCAGRPGSAAPESHQTHPDQSQVWLPDMQVSLL